MERFSFYILLSWVILLYTPSFYFDFVLDDAFLIIRNRYFENGDVDWWSIISGDLWSGEENPDGISSFYRPIFLLTIGLDVFLFNFDPFYFHIHSLLWHLLCIVVFWKLLLQLNFRKEHSLLACAFFALHPINSEVVLWISSRNDSIAGFFACCSLLSALHNRTFAVFLFSLGAYFSKESTILLPLWIFVCLLGRDSQHKSVWSSSFALIPWFFVRLLLEIPTQIPDENHISLFLHTLPTTIVHVAGSVLFPVELSAVRPLAWYNLNILVGFGSLVFFFLYFFSSERKYFWLGVVSYFPVLLPIALNGIYGDRYLYIPLFWFSIWVSSFDFKKYKWLYIIVLLGFSYRTSQRIPEWKNDLYMWNAEVLRSDSSYSKASLAHILYNEGHYEMALNYYKDAFDDDVPYLDGCTIYLSLILKNRSPQMVIDEYSWLRKIGCEKEGTLDGVLLLALVATHQFTQAEELVSNMEFDRSRRSDVGRSVLAIRRNDWSIACEAKQNWSNPEQFASQLQIMLKQIEWMENNVPLEDGFLHSKCRNPKQSQ